MSDQSAAPVLARAISVQLAQAFKAAFSEHPGRRITAQQGHEPDRRFGALTMAKFQAAL